MTIYVEYVIVDNMVINSLLLILTKKLLHLKTNKLRIFFGALMGTIIALISPLLPNIVSLILKIPLAILMLIVSFNFKSFKKLSVSFLTFLCLTFLFGGAVIGIMELFGIKFLIRNGIEYEYNLPVGLAVLVGVITYLCIKNITQYILHKNSHYNYVFDATIQYKNKVIKSTAFLDSGNKITVDGKPVCIINYKIFKQLCPNINITDVLLKKELELENVSYIEIESIGNEKQKLLSFVADSIEINGKKTENVRLALSLIDFSKKTESNIIVSNEIIGDKYETCKT